MPSTRAVLSVTCVKRDGQIALDDMRLYREGLAQFGDGEDLILTIETAETHRSTAQNRFFHGPVLKAFMETGLHKQEAKDMLALLLIPTDIRLPDGSIARVPGHTSALSKAEMTAFIEACIQLAAEQGLVIQDSDQWLADQQQQQRASRQQVA